jgi:hypothetical protein
MTPKPFTAADLTVCAQLMQALRDSMPHLIPAGMEPVLTTIDQEDDGIQIGEFHIQSVEMERNSILGGTMQGYQLTVMVVSMGGMWEPDDVDFKVLSEDVHYTKCIKHIALALQEQLIDMITDNVLRLNEGTMQEAL